MKKSTTGPTWVATFLKVLTFFVSCIYWQQANAACPVHNHLCTFHALGAKVDVTLPPGVTFNPANTLVIYAIGKDPVTGAASTVDFDNEARLPTYTGDKFLAGNPVNYTLSAGPYIVNTTTYGATHPPGTWSVPGDSGLQITPSQYKNTFNANTAVAKHTGDFNGGENGNIPGATGCPNMPGAANCEAVVVTGNVPSGVYEQKVRLFNFYGVPDPKVDLQVGAYVTGQLVIVNNTHAQQFAETRRLEGTGNTTPTYQYEVYNRQFDPHAAGVATFDRMNWGKVRTVGNEYVQNGHRFLTQVQDNTTTRTTVYGDTGRFTQNTWANKPRVVGQVDLGPKPIQATSQIPEISDRLASIGQSFRPWSLSSIEPIKINVPYMIGVNVAAVEESNRLWLEQYALAQQELSKSALQLMQEGRWKEGGARFWDRLTDPDLAKASFSASAKDALQPFAEVAESPSKAAINITTGGLKGISLIPLGVASVVTRVAGSTDYIGEENETADTLDRWNSWVADTFDEGAKRITKGIYDPNSTLSIGSSIAAPLLIGTKPTVKKPPTLPEPPVQLALPAPTPQVLIPERTVNLVANGSKIGFDDLANFRQELGLPPAGSFLDRSTLAVIEVRGQKIYGINAHGQPVSGVNAISSTHAEIDVLNQIKQKNIDVSGQSLTLYVDRAPCAACGANGGIRSMVEQLRLRDLTIIGPDGSTIITPR